MAQHRKGHITASTVDPFLTGKGDKLLKGGVQAARVIALERMELEGLVEIEEGFTGNDFTDWGNAHERDALSRYSAEMFVDIHSSQEVQVHPANPFLSCTPDGLIGDHGVVEVKCPYCAKHHLTNILEKSHAEDHADQVQFTMWVTGRKWADVVSYSPRFREPLDIVIERVPASPEWQRRAAARIEQAEIIIANTIKKIKSEHMPDTV